ncbi:MAG: FIG01043888: hypothetical protein [uncultured Solirubrobacteraceae bacterium]|uniref:Uncharacterized protein n=1 Tax=uncultured Solirubrobacteraceae bacterium TaxID=1162706 RepID=A0A6J4SUY0_9ACTN|nr:MAG: FIG01043888: hypothetical protein [uncultured Solirubrobacteraceae bacterium]
MRHGTYSITARDPETGALGVAIHSHWFSVGPLCAWARPGAGAIATQSVAEPAYGARGLDAMASGEPAPDALERLLAADESARVRQVAMVDGTGRVAAHTGADCIQAAGHVTGDGFSCQANMMLRETVPAAMAAAFAAADGELPERLLAALEGAEAEGGDIRGRQSAAMLVVPAAGEAWESLVDLRVDDHTQPLDELRRLMGLDRAYTLALAADELLGAGDFAAAVPLYERASALAPESDELVFWAGIGLASSDLEAGVAKVRQAAEVNPNWLLLLDRLSPDFAPAGAELRRALGR